MYTVVTLSASQCPTPMSATSLDTLQSATNNLGNAGLVAFTVGSGQDILSPSFNRNFKQLDLTGRFGGGGYAIAMGLDITASGTTAIISPGQAVIDGIIELSTSVNLPLIGTDGRYWIWLSRGSIVSYLITTSQPDNPSALLGSCKVVGGVITEVDTSGVMYIKGGTLWRQTADIGTPSDTPPSSLQFYLSTIGGTDYWWNGTSYKAFGGDGFVPDYIPAGVTLTVPVHQQMLLFDTLTVDGTLVVNGKLKVFPR